jgi:hypothetical protein
MLCWLRSVLAGVFCLAAIAVLTACSPALDWREVQSQAGAVVMFPCKPSRDVRTIPLLGVPTQMTLQACQADGVTYALAVADVVDPARVASAVTMLRASLADNLSATPTVMGPLQVEGMTPNPLAERIRLNGRLPDGRTMQQEAGFFVKGTRVFQAIVMGPKVEPEAVGTFFDSLKFSI